MIKQAKTNTLSLDICEFWSLAYRRPFSTPAPYATNRKDWIIDYGYALKELHLDKMVKTLNLNKGSAVAHDALRICGISSSMNF